MLYFDLKRMMTLILTINLDIVKMYLYTKNEVLSYNGSKVIIWTRKSSCVNARGIPTAAYQVLHLLLEVGYPPAGVLPPGQSNGGYPRWGTPQPGLMEGSTQGGVPPGRGTPQSGLMGVPKVGTPSRGTPWPGLVGGTWGGYPLAGEPPPPPGPGLGTPPSGPGRGTPPPRCGQTDGWTDTCQNITFPRTTYAVGNKQTDRQTQRQTWLDI